VSAPIVVLAVPPKALAAILTGSPEPVKGAFGVLDDTRPGKSWVSRVSYINDIPVTFHWGTALDVPRVWGFPKSDWGVVWVELSKYMDFQDPRSRTVFSVCATRVDAKSSRTGKTLNESTQAEMIEEIFAQLAGSFPGYTLPRPDASILHPGVSQVGGQWVDADSAYMDSAGVLPLCAQGKVPGLYNLGTQNGRASYSFTSMESAVSNALALAHELEPSAKARFPLRRLWRLSDTIRAVLGAVLVVVLCIIVVPFLTGRRTLSRPR
jgi:hypothetical protein